VIVVGIGRLGESLILNTARRWRYSGSISSGRLRITLIDKKAKNKKESLYLKYPQLEKVCELLPVEIDVNSAEFEQGAFLFNQNRSC